MGLKSGKTLLVGLLLFIVLIYSKLLSGFFQQDEWFSFTIYLLHRNLNIVDMLKFLFAPNIGHYNPLTNGVQQILFSIWGMNYIKFATLGIVLHLLVVTTLYFLAKLIFKGNKILALATSLLFGIFASTYEGTSWVVADISTLCSSLLGIVSSILFFIFLRRQENKYLLWSLTVVVISLLFKEITIGLLSLFLIVTLFEGKNKVLPKHRFLIIAFGIVYILLRVGMLLGPNINGDKLVTQSQSMGKLIYNFVTIPLKVLSQTIFPHEFIRVVAGRISLFLPEKLTGLPKSPQFDTFVVKRAMEFLSVSIGLIIPILTATFVFRKKISQSKGVAVFSLGWVLFNSFIFAFAPEQPNVIFAVDSRNLYFASIGVSIFIVWVINILSREKFIKFFLLLFPILFFNTYWLNKNLNQFVEKGKIRKNILNEIITHHPNLPEKAVFYTESDSSFYGLPENERIFPFQSGFGQTLLVWYFKNEYFPDGFYQDKFLWGITDQGYKETLSFTDSQDKEVGSRGFGYFRDFELLVKEMKEKKLSPETVISFRYDSKLGKVIDNTEEVRGRLEGALSQERKVEKVGLGITPSVNTGLTRFMLDNDRKTYWDSKVSYKSSQNIIIDLRSERKVSSVELDSYDNKDQNRVGYRISLSHDRVNWKEVFYSQVYPPPENGLNRLHFRPQFARFLEIKQIGSHDFAKWVVYEIDVYEATD